MAETTYWDGTKINNNDNLYTQWYHGQHFWNPDKSQYSISGDKILDPDGKQVDANTIKSYSAMQNAENQRQLMPMAKLSMGLGALNSGLNAYNNIQDIWYGNSIKQANNQVEQMRNNTRLALGQFKNSLNTANQIKQNRAIGLANINGLQSYGNIDDINQKTSELQNQINNWNPNAQHTTDEILKHKDNLNSLSKYNNIKNRMTYGDLKQETIKDDYLNINSINPDVYQNSKSIIR